MHVLIEIQPLNMSTGERETVRVASAQDRRITGLNGAVWVPAITQMPVLSIRLFDGDFSSTVEPGAATFTINLTDIALTDPNIYAYLWAGASVSIYAESPGTAWPWTRRFVGKVSRFEKSAKRLQLVAEVDSAALDKDVLYLTYAGTTGLAGGADLKDRVRPWVWGHVKSIEPIQIDIDNSVFQVSGYGAISGIPALYERGSSFGASQGDYANYAALVAATIPPGKWATCLAQGLFRLGAPPFGVITADVHGHLVSGSVPRRTGVIIKAMAAALGISSDSIDAASLDALDVAVPHNINIYLTEQTSFFNFAQQLCLPCNAYSGMSWTGKFFAVRPVFGSAGLTLHGQGRADPPVLEMIEGGVNPPFKKTIFGADRCWRVHTTTEIAYQDILIDRGRYQASETYRAGNIVDLSDGSRWLYIADTATAGNEPADGSAFWTQISDQVQPVYLDGTPIEDLKPAEPDATEGAVIPAPGSGEPGNVKDESGNVRDPGEMLNSEIELTAAGRLQYRPLPDADPEVLGQLSLPDLGAIGEAAFRRAEDDIDQVATALAVALNEASKSRETFTSAGFYVDDETGQVRIHAIEQTKERVGTAEIRLNAAEASITLRATTSYVNEQIALAVIDPSQIADLDDIFLRLGAAEVAIDGLNATVTLLATVTELSLVEGRVTTAETAIDALEGTISSKVDTTTFDALATRVTNAETTLSAMGDSAQIVNSVSAIRLLEKAQDANAEADLWALLQGDRNQRDQVAAIAAARQELTARIIDGDEAEASFRLALQVRVGAAEAALVSESFARASADSALAASINSLGVSLDTEIDNREAAVSDEAQARIDADGLIAAGLAQQVTAGRVLEGEASELADLLLGSLLNNDRNRREVNGAVAGARQELTAQIVSEVEALSTRILALVASVAGNQASIVQESIARATADGALAAQVTTLETTVGENTATLTEFAESIDGLEARWGAKVEVGDKIGGFLLNGTGEAVDADFLVDTFRVSDPDTGETYLSADADGLRLQNGKVVMDNDTNMLVIGAGFGVDSQFVLWFGPSREISLCDEDSALFFLDVTGDGEYGLRLGSNFYKNSGTGTAVGPDAQITVGPFVTDGGSKQVALSYNYLRTVQISDAFAYSGTPQAVIRVERQVGDGSFTTVGDYTFNGSATGIDPVGGEPGLGIIQIQQAASFTDTTAGSDDFIYRATIISRSVGGLSSTVIFEDSLSQTVTLISTEQIT